MRAYFLSSHTRLRPAAIAIRVLPVPALRPVSPAVYRRRGGARRRRADGRSGRYAGDRLVPLGEGADRAPLRLAPREAFCPEPRSRRRTNSLGYILSFQGSSPVPTSRAMDSGTRPARACPGRAWRCRPSASRSRPRAGRGRRLDARVDVLRDEKNPSASAEGVGAEKYLVVVLVEFDAVGVLSGT